MAFAVIISTFSIGIIDPSSIEGQISNNTKSTAQNMEDALIDLYPGVTTEFIGNDTTVLMGDEQFLVGTEGTMKSFWLGIEKIKQFGYELDEITTSGDGTDLNPTRFYAVLSLQNTTGN